jgi:TusA-related sulfurtransferase/predicted peroxiredoxin
VEEIMTAFRTQTSLDLTDKTIATYVLYEVHEALAACAEGERIEAITDARPAIDNDLHAWSRATGNSLVEVTEHGKTRRYVIEKGPPHHSDHKLAAIISDDGLFELLSPLGFALAAALEGHDVSLYFQGPAVRVLAPGYRARMHGLGRPFSRFPRDSLAKAGHLPPQDKLRQLQHLGAQLFACGPSMEHYKVDPTDLAFSDVTIAAYLTFMEQMDSADIHLVP